MTFAASHSRATDLNDAIRSTAGEVRSALGGAAPDLSFVFVSHAYKSGFSQLAARLTEATRSKILLGCTGETIIGGGEEIESGPALSLWSAVLPNARVEAFVIRFERTVDGIVMSGLPSLGDEESAVQALFLLGEPYSCAPHSVLEHFAAELPGVPIHGGMASGGAGAGANRLFCEAREVRQGAVGVVVRGGGRIRSVVSQGCRPIGSTYLVTSAEQNVIHALGGLPPLQRLQETFATLSERDGELVQKGLHLGLAMNEYQEQFERGDFLISNVIGADRETGSLQIAAPVRVGQTVRFHVRDADTADEDLIGLLAADKAANPAPPQASLLFSCNGRGTRLFPHPNHDAAAIQRIAGRIPLAGFFAQGELGPIGGRNFLHGFTASIALFE
jgi:small ligand-binding sensory domain FIST